MAEPSLYRASVPVLVAALDRIAATLAEAAAQLGDGLAEALDRRPAPGMRPAGQQAAMAVQFALRAGCNLAGRRVPELPGALDAPGLAARIATAREILAGLAPGDFDGAAARVVRDQAGFATVELTGVAYLQEFALPNLHFHHAMLHVALKQAGVRLGKADFDGKHDYPEGFSFG